MRLDLMCSPVARKKMKKMQISPWQDPDYVLYYTYETDIEATAKCKQANQGTYQAAWPSALVGR